MVLIIGAYIEIYTNISHAQIWDTTRSNNIWQFGLPPCMHSCYVEKENYSFKNTAKLPLEIDYV